MVIFDWEQSTIDLARSLPQVGFVHDFFYFWTDYSQSKWLAIVFLFLLALRIGWRHLIVPAILILFAVVSGDLLSYRIFKLFFLRPRPNYVGLDCQLSKCWGFVSSHATNITAAAVVLCLYDKRNLLWTVPVVILVCISRVYLQDHFPLDVIGGIFLGVVVGGFVWTCYSIFKNRLQKIKSVERI